MTPMVDQCLKKCAGHGGNTQCELLIPYFHPYPLCINTSETSGIGDPRNVIRKTYGPGPLLLDAHATQAETSNWWEGPCRPSMSQAHVDSIMMASDQGHRDFSHGTFHYGMYFFRHFTLLWTLFAC